MAAEANHKSQKTVPYYEQVANILRTNIVDSDDRNPLRLPRERMPKPWGQLAVDCLLDRALGRRSIPVRLAGPTQLERGQTVRQVSPGI